MLIADINDLHHDYMLNRKSFYRDIKNYAKSGNHNKKIGFYGQPDQKVMDLFIEEGYSFLDLDIDFKVSNVKIVQDDYCHIIRNIINNAICYRDSIEYIICTSGRDKCDQGRNVRDILSRLDFKVIDGSNLNKTKIREPIISMARHSLKDRVIRIMNMVYAPLSEQEKDYYINNRCEPQFNYHGVPPHDIDLLNIFPDDTHIEGWIRLVEMGIPSRDDMEWDIYYNIPTVFYAQSFCNKQIMSKFLADRYNGLYLDGHGRVTGSILAKLEAFIRLKRKQRINYKIVS